MIQAKYKAMRVFVLLLALAATLLGGVGIAAAHQDQYELPGQNVFPEGVAYDPSTGYFYVSSTAGGAIFRGNFETGEVTTFLPAGGDGRNVAVGLKVDDVGRLYVAGATMIFVYDTANGNLLGKFDPGTGGQSFINDVAVSPDRDAYFTDSSQPYIYKVTPDGRGNLSFSRWLDLTGSPIVYAQGQGVAGINLNGIAVSGDGKYLIVGQTNTGKLFRITIASKEISEINVGEPFLADGLLLEAQLLLAVRNGSEVAAVSLSDDLLSGTVIATVSDPSFAFPTTIARVGEHLLVVNSQFDKQAPGTTPTNPFTVTVIDAPAFGGTPGMPRTGDLGGYSLAWWIGALVAFLGLGVRVLALRRT